MPFGAQRIGVSGTDTVLEFRELQNTDPALDLDMAAVADAVWYARGETVG